MDAFEATVRIVEAKLTSSSHAASQTSGNDTADFIKTIYAAVTEIYAHSISDEDLTLPEIKTKPPVLGSVQPTNRPY